MSRQNIKALSSARMAIRAIRAYRTVSGEAAITLAGMVPFDHLTKAHGKVYWRTREKAGQGQQPVTMAEQAQLAKQRVLRCAWRRWKQELARTGAERRRVAGTIMPNWE